MLAYYLNPLLKYLQEIWKNISLTTFSQQISVAAKQRSTCKIGRNFWCLLCIYSNTVRYSNPLFSRTPFLHKFVMPQCKRIQNWSPYTLFSPCQNLFFSTQCTSLFRTVSLQNIFQINKRILFYNFCQTLWRKTDKTNQRIKCSSSKTCSLNNYKKPHTTQLRSEKTVTQQSGTIA